jgi:hypothetical protein
MKIGVLTGGGDAPGTNAVIRAIVRKAIKQYDDEVLGIRDGWHGLLEADFTLLNQEAITAILTRGGSILGFSRTNPFKSENGVQRILKNIEKSETDAMTLWVSPADLAILELDALECQKRLITICRGQITRSGLTLQYRLQQKLWIGFELLRRLIRG